MGEEEDVIEVIPAANQRHLYREQNDNDDDGPLTFNSRRSKTIDAGVNSRSLTAASLPTRQPLRTLDVSYEVDNDGKLLDIFLCQPTSPSSSPPILTETSSSSFPALIKSVPQSDAREAFERRRERLIARMGPFIRPTRDIEAQVRIQTTITSSSTSGASSQAPTPSSTESDDWELESLDDFIASDDEDLVIIDDSDGELQELRKIKPSKKGPESPVFILDSTSEDEDTEVGRFSRNPARALSRIAGDDDLTELERLLSKVEDRDDLRSLYPESLQGKSTNEDQNLHMEKDVLRSSFPRRLVFSTQARALDLHNFEIYRCPQTSGKGLGGQLESLYTFVKPSGSRARLVNCLIDATCYREAGSCPLEGMQIEAVIIGNLDDPGSFTTRNHIHISTSEGSRYGVQYHLLVPSWRYKDTFEAFVWIADLAKHIFRYLAAASEDDRLIRLDDFQTRFWHYIESSGDLGQQSDTIQQWHNACGNAHDFRRHLIRYGDFLFGQAVEVHEAGLFTDLLLHPLWEDLGQSGGKVKSIELRNEPTVVTSFIADTFLQSFPQWGEEKFDLLEVVHLEASVAEEQQRHCDKLRFPQKVKTFGNQSFHVEHGSRYSVVDVVLQDAARQFGPLGLSAHQTSGSAIVIKHLDDYRFAYVKDVVDDCKVSVIWLLRPHETICGSREEGTFYPVGSELFFSDECCCETVKASKILWSGEIQLFAEHGRYSDELFVHSLYKRDSQSFHTSEASSIWEGCMSCARQPSLNGTARKHETMPPQLDTLSLFSGAGLLDHGVASTSFFKTKLAIEIDETAMLSHKANEHGHVCQYYHGSTNSYLADMVKGRIPFQRFHCVVAGCPCQGYSRLNANKSSREAHRNCSMLANTLSYVDLLRPEFVLIENVKDMEHFKPGKANACAQAVCCLVAMGYQVRKMVLSAGDFDAATKRTRLFIIAAGPGLQLPEEPLPVPPEDRTVSSWSVIEDLPVVHNDTVVNVSMPDHIPYERLPNDFDAKISLRGIVKRVPVTGPKRNLFGAFDSGKLSKRQEKWFANLTEEKQARGSNSLQRVNPEGLFPTITRYLVPLNSRGGDSLHPYQHRVVTVEELRRAQGLPDDFLLIGSMQDAVSQIGNGVVWQVAQALGRSIGQAWAASQPDVESGADLAYSFKEEEQPVEEERSTTRRRSESRPVSSKRKVVWEISDSDDDESDNDVQFISQRPLVRPVDLNSPMKKLRLGR